MIDDGRDVALYGESLPRRATFQVSFVIHEKMRKFRNVSLNGTLFVVAGTYLSGFLSFASFFVSRSRDGRDCDRCRDGGRLKRDDRGQLRFVNNHCTPARVYREIGRTRGNAEKREREIERERRRVCAKGSEKQDR